MLNIREQYQQIEIGSWLNWETIEFRKCLLFGSQHIIISYIFESAEDQDIRNNSIAIGFVWLWNMVCYFEERK
jgi:hypothetical protein